MNDKTIQTTASISTMWAIKNFSNLDDFILTARKIGFQKIELNHQVNTAMLSGINLDHTQFSGIHEPCPADISTKELVDRDWLISSSDEASRKRGVETVKGSINLAHKLGAPVVIVHCGIVSPILLNLERSLRILFDEGKAQSHDYLEIKSEMIELREKLADPHLNAVKKSLTQLVEYADKFKIRLGLENRYHFMDIPSIDEMDDLLNLTADGRLGFIYDIGHAQAMDRLGFYRHEDWLTRYSARMLGCHLHDVIGFSDHLAPGLGEIDYKKIAPYLSGALFRTLEISPANTLEQVRRGIDLLIETGCV